MPSRRDFIRQSSLLTAGFIIDKDDWARKKRPVGVQLYTLRNEMGKDPRGTLEKVAQLGYKQVETFSYSNRKWFGFTPAELSTILKNNGLVSPSGHVFSGSLFLKDGWEDNWKAAVEDSKALGQEYIVIPWLEEQNRKAENYKRIAEGLNKAGEICRQSSIQLAYHNHDFEFVDVNGQTGFDTLTKETDKKLVCFELDIFWAVKANHDPLTLFQQHPKRFPLWHVKDMDKTEKKSFTEVGNGIIDFSAIFKKANQSGMKYFFVEQDVCPGPPLDSIEKSITYLKKNIVK
jgi:sugar phosphate isomerase/epimerase